MEVPCDHAIWGVLPWWGEEAAQGRRVLPQSRKDILGRGKVGIFQSSYAKQALSKWEITVL
jgi:hypothetical protein